MKLKEFNGIFSKAKDFRQEHKVKHNLVEIMFIAVVATIANANT